MPQNLQTTIKAEGIAAAINAATGQKSTVIYTPEGIAKISFSRDAQKNLQNYLYAQIQKKTDIEIDFLPIVAPIVFKKVMPYAAAALAALLLTGYIIGTRAGK